MAEYWKTKFIYRKDFLFLVKDLNPNLNNPDKIKAGESLILRHTKQ